MPSEQVLPDPGHDAPDTTCPDYGEWLASMAGEEPPDPEMDSWYWADSSPDSLPAGPVPGQDSELAAGLGAGGALDQMLPCGALAMMAEDLAGDRDRYEGASDDELAGAVALWDRVQAYATARKLGAVAAFIRVRPEPGCELADVGDLPILWDEFAADEVAQVLAESRDGAGKLLEFAHALTVKLPGTLAALRTGEIREAKAWIMVCAARALDPAEARAAEKLVLGRAGRLTPGGLRAAIARAVMEVAPEKARTRREDAAKDARVERWPEDSGNAALAGRELPPAAVLAIDERINAWARELKRAGLTGTMDELRARAFLDICLGQDSRPRPGSQARQNPAPDSSPAPGSDPAPEAGPGPAPDAGTAPAPGGESAPPAPSAAPDAMLSPAGGPLAGLIPAAFAARINLTVPLTTLLGLADRPGELSGLGPVDPALTRDLVRSAARSPESEWCITVTDDQGHAIGHGCARPEPRKAQARRAKPPPGAHDPPGTAAGPPGPGFSFTGTGDDGPPGSYGSWRLATGIPGHRDLLASLDPLATGTCDHRFAAAGHDPGVKLRHLANIRHDTCTSPICRRPAKQCDFEHNIPFEAGGRTCLCNGGPKCRHDHRLKQDPRWKVEHLTPAIIRWTTPTGRQYTTEPTRHPI
jgi:Domain of unknown function (DUF222)